MVYMYHSFLVHSSADGHLGCFHVLAMTNSYKRSDLVPWEDLEGAGGEGVGRGDRDGEDM